MSAGAALAAVPRAALQATRRQFGGALLLFGFALLAGLPLLLWPSAPARPVLALAVSGGIVLLGGWMALCSNVLQQNHPQLARLVPGHVQRLRQVLMLGWLALVLPVLLASLLWLEQGPLLLTVPIALVLLVLGSALRWPLLWLLLWVPSMLPLLMQQQPQLKAASLRLLVWSGEQPWLVLALLLVGGLALLSAIVSGGGAAHERQYRRMQAWRQSFRQASQGKAVIWLPRVLAEQWQRLMHGGFLSLLRWHLARPRGGFGRQALGLGPRAHWSLYLSQLPLLLLTLLLVVGLLVGSGALRVGGDWALQGMVNASIGALAYLASVAQLMRTTLVTTRQEQALLSLLPGTPRGAALNRALALRLMGQYLLLWALVFGLLWLVVGHWPQNRPALLAYALAALPLGPWLWTDWSRAKAPGSLQAGLPYMLPILGGTLAQLALREGLLTPAALVALVLGPTLLVAAWRWRLAINAPQAFPAGRA